jgi:hypothetical protein
MQGQPIIYKEDDTPDYAAMLDELMGNDWWPEDEANEYFGWPEDEEDDEAYFFPACIRCSCIIGDEVGFGTDFGEGPICDVCWPYRDED